MARNVTLLFIDQLERRQHKRQIHSDRSVNNLVAAVIVELMICLSSWLRGQKARTVKDLAVVFVVAVAIAIDVFVLFWYRSPDPCRI